MSAPSEAGDSLAAGAERAAHRAAERLAGLQGAGGHWRGEVAGDGSCESDFILLQVWLGASGNPRVRKAARAVLAREPGGDVNLSVKVYCALKAAGLAPEDAPMRRRRERILALGGVQAANDSIKLTLSGFGLHPRQDRASAPPEIAVPLSVALAGPARPAPFDIRELWIPGAAPEIAPRGGFLQRLLRGRAAARDRAWVIEHLPEATVLPATVCSAMALDASGHPLRDEALRRIDASCVEDGDRLTVQPWLSPARDTALAAYAMAQAAPGHRALGRAGEWLRAQDWSGAGDLAAALLAAPDQSATERLLAMQLSDGGWGAFGRPYGDITGCALEALAANGSGAAHPAVRWGVEWLVRHQEADGSWLGRAGVAYVHGTCFALRGLAAAGESDREAHVLRGGEWLRSIQNADGGWGESCAGYERGVFTAGPSTPSQTAWAILGLIAGGDSNSLSVRGGVDHLLRTQRADGSWAEEQATATAVPGLCYARCEMYCDCFPTMALAAFSKARATGEA